LLYGFGFCGGLCGSGCCCCCCRGHSGRWEGRRCGGWSAGFRRGLVVFVPVDFVFACCCCALTSGSGIAYCLVDQGAVRGRLVRETRVGREWNGNVNDNVMERAYQQRHLQLSCYHLPAGARSSLLCSLRWRGRAPGAASSDPAPFPWSNPPSWPLRACFLCSKRVATVVVGGMRWMLLSWLFEVGC